MQLRAKRFDELPDGILYVGHEGITLVLRHEARL
jgi:hypothetical protein